MIWQEYDTSEFFPSRVPILLRVEYYSEMESKWFKEYVTVRKLRGKLKTNDFTVIEHDPENATKITHWTRIEEPC
jgi:hypothetical protein